MKAAALPVATGLAGWLAAAPCCLQAQTTATVTNTRLQSNFNGATGAGQTAPIAANPSTCSSGSAFTSITSVSITFTVIDGDTGLGPQWIRDSESLDRPHDAAERDVLAHRNRCPRAKRAESAVSGRGSGRCRLAFAPPFDALRVKYA